MVVSADRKMQQLLYLIIASLALNITATAAPLEVVFLIASQDGSGYHRQLCAKLSQDIMDQSRRLDAHYHADYVINIKILHEIFNGPGDWSPLNVLPHLWSSSARRQRPGAPMLGENTAWVIWCEDTTQVNLPLLLDQLSLEDHTQMFYSGYALHDRDATIIHHFAFFKDPKWFPYPLLRSGIIFTAPLLKRLSAFFETEAGRSLATTEFSIDAAHELARAILHIPAGSSESDGDGGNDDDNNASTANVPNEMPQTGSVEEKYNKVAAAPQHQGWARTKSRNVTLPRNVLLRQAPYICGTAAAAAAAASTPLHNGEGHKDALVATDAGNKDTTTNGQGQHVTPCAMYAKPMDLTTCLPVQRDEIYFAIKTCQKFHKERIPVLQATWTPFTRHMKYFSDVADATVPTTAVGVPNTETGHCAKTLAILKLALKDIDEYNKKNKSSRRPNKDQAPKDNRRRRGKQLLNQLKVEGENEEARLDQYKSHSPIRWLFLSDDDTLLSVAGLSEYLGCFDPHADVYLGERYGYRLHAADGFNYITGGGGIAFSLSTARKIVAHCTCPTPAAPDDMLLGACLRALRVHATHSSRFHQARPADYSPDVLRLEEPISFHKFWQLDPRHVYERWFATRDRRLLVSPSAKRRQSSAQSQSLHNHSRRQVAADAQPPPLACQAHTSERHVDL